jgi:1,4-alpha-glucan branching enzyme
MKAMRLVLTALLVGVVRPEEPTAAVSRFRLYAPDAGAVVIKPVGSRAAGWLPQPMTQDPAVWGFWNATVAGMHPGDGYGFTVDGTDRIDPSCFDISTDSTHSIVPLP